MIYFKDTCRSLNCSLFISNVIIKRRSRLGFTQIHKPRASKRILAAHPNPRQGFKHLGLVTILFWLLDLPSTPDHTNSNLHLKLAQNHIRPHFSFETQQLLNLYTEAALSTQNQHFTRGTALEHLITAICSGVFLTKVWEQCGEEEGGSLLWLLPFSCLWLLLPVASFPVLSFLPLNLAT